jgi:quercetin dioxygenase-like cupin family protein
MLSKKNMLLLGCGILLGAAVTLLAQQRGVTQRIPQFENSDVRVWKTIIMPDQPLSMHRHENGRTIVALVGGTLTVKKENGQTSKLTWESGKAYWLGPDPPGELHGDLNETGKPIEVMVIEMQKK